LNPPLLQDAVGSHIYGNIGGSFLEAKAFYPHRHSRWLKHAKAPIKNSAAVRRGVNNNHSMIFISSQQDSYLSGSSNNSMLL
jgi:hypothetical protein